MKALTIISLIISIAILTGCQTVNTLQPESGLTLTPNFSTSAAMPVKLYFGRTLNNWIGYWNVETALDGYIEIENLAYTKQVSVVYRVYDPIYGWGNWTSVAASYNGFNGGKSESWYFKTPVTGYFAKPGNAKYQFAIKYTVNGKDYWDNNNGKDYIVEAGNIVFGQSQVLLLAANALSINSEPATFSGNILIKNLSPTKVVKVLYTLNNWATSSEAPASYGYTQPDGNEVWGFSKDISASSGDIKFAISYTVNGYTTWDNNFLKNYTISISNQTIDQN